MDMQCLTSMHEFMHVADPAYTLLSAYWIYVEATRGYSRVVKCTVIPFVIVHWPDSFDSTGLDLLFKWRDKISYLPDRILCKLVIYVKIRCFC